MTETKTKDLPDQGNAPASLPPPDPPIDLSKLLRTDDK
jgi:hypothetical protein